MPESYWPADRAEELLELTLGDLLRQVAAEVPDRLALIDADPDPAARRTWTYAELLEEAERVARALLARFEPGERLAIWAPNCAEWMLLQQGASLAGLILVTVNPAYRASELEFVLAQSGAAGIFCTDSYRGFDMAVAVATAREGAPELREALSLSGFEAFAASGDPSAQLPEVAPGDPVQIQYTSGTTGFPKGALLHHRGVINASRFVAARAGVQDGPVWINAMPMFHIGGGALTEIGCMTHRGTYVLLPGFDPALVLETLETYHGTITLAVPTMLVALLDHPDAKTRDLSSLQTLLSGAAVVPAALVRRATQTWGCGFTILFGQTEMHGVISQTLLSDSPADQENTIGRPLPQVEVCIADPATGERLPVGEPGEICARGYQTMLGYFDCPQETADTLADDGWLRSGDLGVMDERGYLSITGRLKDMIIRGGENIYPREVEDLLFSHPAVAEVAVVGTPHERWGEEVAAVLRLSEGQQQPPAEELRAYCREHLAGYKTPAVWYVVDAFPVTPSGKIQKFVLQERIEAGELGEPATA